MPTSVTPCFKLSCFRAAKWRLRGSLRRKRAVAHAPQTKEADVASMSNDELKEQLRLILGEPELDEGELQQYDGVRCAASFESCRRA
jgi:outer membrane protein assembly factor BamE (lipoprotein component of BamABCDE complex)